MRALVAISAVAFFLGGCAAADGPYRSGSYDAIRVVSRGDDYRLVDSHGRPITENELARRYLATTGLHDLDDVERHRRPALAISSAAALPAPVTLLGWGIADATTPRDEQRAPSSFHVLAIGVGAIGSFVLPIAFAAAMANRDGSPDDHDLSRRQAEYFVGIYNERLRDNDTSPAP